MKSVMTHQFSQVPQAEIQRSSFDRSHGLKTTFDAGLLVPIFLDEALPGDTFNLSMTGFARLATPIKPIMDNLHMETFFFSVPYRLVWDNWQKFNGEQESPGDSTDYKIPMVEVPAGGYDAHSIGDYFGLPTANSDPYEHSALFHRAYAVIWNEWFRDQNLEPHVDYNTGDETDAFYNHACYNRTKRHDYFTSCLPWPQKGEPILVPINATAPVVPASSTAFPTFKGQTGTGVGDTHLQFQAQSAEAHWEPDPSGGLGQPAQARWEESGLVADLSNTSGWSINELREAFQLQRMLERDARGGTRYIEVIKSHFGVTSPDARLQRPEFLGGGHSPVNITPVAQTQGTDTVEGFTPQANLAAIGTAQLHGHGFTKSFTEHCLIMGIVSVRADLTYQQGLDRMWSRSTRYDFYWPALAHLGEQAVMTKEIYCRGNANDDLVFGYQERYAEYRYKPSKITGKFRSTDPQPLDIWHLSQEFTNTPTLGIAFISEQVPLDRCLAVQDEPHFLFDAYFKLKCARPMPLYGVPGNIDHF